MDDLRPERLAPFVFFGRVFDGGARGRELDGPALRHAISVVAVLAGTLHIERPDGTRDRIGPGGAGIAESGSRLLLAPRAEIGVVYGDLIRRAHRRKRDGVWWLGRDTPHPPLADLFGRPLPLVAPRELRAAFHALVVDIIARAWRSPLDHAEANAALHRLILDLVRPHDEPLAERFLQLVDQRLRFAPTVADLARTLGVTVPALRTALRAADLGEPAAVLHARRMAVAAERLRTALPLTVIAASVGYRSTVSFIRAFRLAHGTTPEAWRTRLADHS